ncbi:putative tubulin tyrosine ligase [Trypanosoma rangeli]|uniref:Putative tubulin tyrosine ligase n=1 Tax=Trypanosoma rangeli TaxID=5698 RepID=A0A422P136_TRYRA|nr:putative tubulin tyrosine ligase [Trypanosoma rangeli]RNF11440.1 putative tubulin tyrosine ligase [Trypanosoma rangeli]|eukprot:RNF11440.1 putative tubulin tyrosine ligase [Trypanosoma rangeli]
MAGKILAPPHNLPTFYPQSLGFLQHDGRDDTDVMTAETTYFLPRHQRLVVGKFVPDINNEDPSNPKHVPQTLERVRLPRTSLLPRRSNGIVFSVASSFGDATSPHLTPREEPGSAHKVATEKTQYTLVKPLYPFSAPSLFFPIRHNNRGGGNSGDARTPLQLNLAYHGSDRPNYKLGNLSVQKNNLNRMCLYKLGPGAVAFKVVIDAFEVAGMQYTPSNELFNVIWAKRATPYTLSHLGPYQKVNHFPGTWGIGRKDSLALNIGKMQRYFGVDAFDIIPASFLIPKQWSALEDYVKRQPDTSEDPLILIVKPSASSCGRGIRLYHGMPPMPTGSSQMVCQRYLGNPMLIYGRKFDLRLYCVVTSFDPLRIFLFDEGLVRFAAQKYPGMDKDLDNIHVHLTNYSVNKMAELNRASRGKEYQTDDPVDIKWCLSDLRQYLMENQKDGKLAWELIMRGCEDAVIKAFLSIENDVVERIRKECSDKAGRGCFEMYGLDLMADKQYNVRLIEVNIMPSLATGTPLDKAVKSRMLAHLLTLIRVIPHQRNASGPTPPNFGEEPSDRHETRYRFGRHPHQDAELIRKPLLTRFNDPRDPDSVLSPGEYLLLVEAEEELACAGGFRRIFPTAENVLSYLPYFTHGVLRNNYLLASAVRMQAKAND